MKIILGTFSCDFFSRRQTWYFALCVRVGWCATTTKNERPSYEGSNADDRTKLHTPLHFQHEISQKGNAKPLIAVVQEIERRIRGVSSLRRLDYVMF